MTIRRLVRGTGLVLLALGGWTAVMIAMPFLGAGGRQVAVVGAPATAVRAVLAAGSEIVEVRRRVTVARSDEAGFVGALYRSGAPLVIEAGAAAGCFGRQPVNAGA
jgi:hypothetical protein